jgi:hypothetical protein
MPYNAVLQRIRADYLEMPGLQLTQAHGAQNPRKGQAGGRNSVGQGEDALDVLLGEEFRGRDDA